MSGNLRAIVATRQRVILLTALNRPILGPQGGTVSSNLRSARVLLLLKAQHNQQ